MNLRRLLWPFVVATISVGVALWRGLDFGAFVLIVLLVATLLAQLPDVLKFSVGPLSAEFRAKVAEAEQILASLKRQSGVLAHPLLDTLAWSNRMGVMTARRRQELMLSVRQELEQQGFTDREVRRLLAEYIRLVGVDYSRFILGDTRPACQDGAQTQEWQRLIAPVEPQPTNNLREFLAALDALNEQTEGLLKDYETFLASGVAKSDFFLDAYGGRTQYHLVPGKGLLPTR